MLQPSTHTLLNSSVPVCQKKLLCASEQVDWEFWCCSNCQAACWDAFAAQLSWWFSTTILCTASNIQYHLLNVTMYGIKMRDYWAANLILFVRKVESELIRGAAGNGKSSFQFNREKKNTSLNVSLLKEPPRILCLAENDLINIFIKSRLACAPAGR